MEMGNRFMRHGRSNSSLDGACTGKKSERKEKSLLETDSFVTGYGFVDSMCVCVLSYFGGSGTR
jgi:hypothetical protein